MSLSNIDLSGGPEDWKNKKLSEVAFVTDLDSAEYYAADGSTELETRDVDHLADLSDKLTKRHAVCPTCLSL